MDISQAGLEAVFRPLVVQLFNDVRVEAKKAVLSKAFGVRGNFQRLVSDGFWQSRVRELFGGVISRVFGGVRFVDELLAPLFEAAGSFTDRISEFLQVRAVSASSVGELVDAVDLVPVFGNVDGYVGDLAHTVSERLRLVEARGARFKVWRTVGDFRVRDSHVGAEGQRVVFGGEFVLGSGARCVAPGGPELPPEDRVNCRCWVEYEF
jgi:hypothetical protein